CWPLLIHSRVPGNLRLEQREKAMNQFGARASGSYARVHFGTALLAAGLGGSNASGQWSIGGLGDLPGGVFLSQANGVSATGMVVVGDSRSNLEVEAF